MGVRSLTAAPQMLPYGRNPGPSWLGWHRWSEETLQMASSDWIALGFALFGLGLVLGLGYLALRPFVRRLR